MGEIHGVGAASRTCSQLSNTNSRARPSNVAATDSLTLLPGCWVMPSTAATASGHRRRIGDCGQLEKPNPVGKLTDEQRRDLANMYKYGLGFLHGTPLIDEAALTDTPRTPRTGSYHRRFRIQSVHRVESPRTQHPRRGDVAVG